MKKLVTYCLAMALSMTLTSAGAQCLLLSKGDKVQVRSTMFANGLPFTEKKWDKMKPEKRDELVFALNERIQSGKESPYSTLESNFIITDVENASPISSYHIKEADGAYDYESTNYCVQDTMHLVRNADVVYSIYQGDTLGLAVQGIQRIPNKLSVGDVLPSYNDFMITIPKTWDTKVKEAVKSFSYTTTKNEIGYMQDSYSGEYSFGEFKVTERKDMYTTVNHDLRITEHIQNLTINYFVAKVTSEEKIEINGKEYDTFIIESESWSKGGVVRDYEAENKRIQAEQEAKFAELQEKQDEFYVKSGYTNDQGYVVTYKREWFLPGYGIVRTEVRDIHGAISTYMDVLF